MPAPKMLSGLPKPVLFGLYGAVGGLLGALFFGELLWFLLRPPPPPQNTEPQLGITTSPDLKVYQGGTNKLLVEIKRDKFDEEVIVRVTKGLPSGVTAGEAKIAAGKTEGEIELVAAQTAVVTDAAKLTVVATAKSGEKELTASPEKAPELSVASATAAQADVVFVLDVTGSMQAQIDGLNNSIGAFAKALADAKVDARFGCVIFRDLFVKEPFGAPQEQLEVLKFKGETFTSDPREFSAVVGRHRASGGGDIPETSFETLSAAARIGDYRKSAVRTLILITDAPPKLVVGLGQSEKDTIDALRDNKIDLLHLVVNPADERTYQRVQEGALSKGKVFDLYRVARNADEMTTKLLPDMTESIRVAAESKRPDTRPELAARPEAASIKSLQSSEQAAAGSEAKLVVRSGVWTGAIAALVCLLLLGGQHHYLRGSLPAVGGVLAALGGGLFVGVLGGAAGQGLFLLANTDSTIVDAIFRVMGWTILGSLAGVGLALFIPNLNALYGLIGGAVGGAVGAVVFIVVTKVLGAALPQTLADVLGRLAGGLALGFFIGVMVAVVEAAFRRAWLEVQYGPREKVTVNLGAEPVKVGSDSRACTVWARGAAEIELRYFIRDGKVICTDVPSRTEETVGDGDTREAGNVTVVVRTGAGSASDEPPRKRRPAPAAPPKKIKAEPKPKPKLKPQPEALSLDDDDDGLEPTSFPLPSPTAPTVSYPPAALPLPPPPPPPSPPRSAPVAAPPARPPAPPAPRPAAPVAPPRPVSPPPGGPAIKPTARDPDACPSCGRKNAGKPGSRYCMVCDQTY